LRCWVIILLAGSIFVLTSRLTIAAPLDGVLRALSSPQPAVLVGVPPEFLNPAAMTDDGSIETQADWAHYLNLWASSVSSKIRIIVVPMNVLTRVLQSPSLAGPCATLFVKNRREGLLYAEDCVPQQDTYDMGAGWLLGTTHSGAAMQDLISTAVTLRRGSNK
jgi:hypothetical protein